MSLDEEVRNIHLQQHQKQLAMYDSGIETGIRMTVDYLIGILPNKYRNQIVEMIINDYKGT